MRIPKPCGKYLLLVLHFKIGVLASALNEYNMVFVIAGNGHYDVQMPVLENMLGKASYICNIPFDGKKEACEEVKIKEKI